MINVQKASDGKLKQLINADGIEFYADVSSANGGDDAGPDPHQLLDAALGACTALTVTMVARRKQIQLDDVQVQITHREEGGVYYLQRQIELIGALTDEQRDYLLNIANKCPIHRALMGRFEIVTTLAG
jgi:putative redox protein